MTSLLTLSPSRDEPQVRRRVREAHELRALVTCIPHTVTKEIATQTKTTKQSDNKNRPPDVNLAKLGISASAFSFISQTGITDRDPKINPIDMLAMISNFLIDQPVDITLLHDEAKIHTETYQHQTLSLGDIFNTVYIHVTFTHCGDLE